MDGVHVLSVLKKQMAEKRDELEEDISSGSAPDYAGYREMVGNVRGILYCERQILDLIARIDVD